MKEISIGNNNSYVPLNTSICDIRSIKKNYKDYMDEKKKMVTKIS